MTTSSQRTWSWLTRSRPRPRELWSALVTSSVSALGRLGLLVASVGLLIDASHHPHWLAIAITLIVIEMVAFLRSPLQFLERMTTHQLGLRAVTRWRTWLIARTARWDYRRWSAFDTGDLLQRFLTDTDELQDLWLRAVIPTATVSLSVAVGDIVVGLLPPRGQWGASAAVLALGQLLSVLIVVASYGPWVQREYVRRQASAKVAAVAGGVSRAAPALMLLGATNELSEAVRPTLDNLTLAHEGAESFAQRLSALVWLTVIGSVAGAVWLSPATSSVWLGVAATFAILAGAELVQLPTYVLAGVRMSGAAERLEAVAAVQASVALATWPPASDIHVRVTVPGNNGGVPVQFDVAAGERWAVIGPSGAGKSTLLRAIAGLEEIDGQVTVAGVDLASIEESQLRRHVAYVGADVTLCDGFVRDVVGLGRPVNELDLANVRSLGFAVEWNTKWQGLSRGERQRVGVARSLVGQPHIVILDEPTSALGAIETQWVLNLLERSGATFIIATHDRRVREWCTRSVELR